MTKRCPPGVICLENVTLLIIIIFLLVVMIFLYYYYTKQQAPQPHHRRQHSSMMMPMPIPMPIRNGNDVLLDVYQPPLRDDRYFQMPLLNVPINVQTRVNSPIDTTFRQVGILTRLNNNNNNNNNDSDTILPLLGRPLLSNRDKWNFYTMNDKNNVIKLPIKFKGKSCMTEYGCDNLDTGDKVYVEGYKEIFKVTSYDNDVIRYL